MAAPSEGFWQRRGWFGLYELLQSWWRHRISFLLSLSITVVALTSYYLVFLQETRTPLCELAQRLELATLDTRFRYRPARFAHPDPRVAIVDIDQKTQEVLGRWPFSARSSLATTSCLHLRTCKDSLTRRSTLMRTRSPSSRFHRRTRCGQNPGNKTSCT